MAGKFEGHIRSKGSGADFEVAKVAIKGRKRRARADDTEVDCPAAFFAEKTLGSVHHFAAEPGPLKQRVDSEQAQITTAAAKFNIDAGRKGGGVTSDEEFAFCHVGVNAFGTDAITLDESLLDAEGGIDQMNERFGISGESGTNLNTLRRKGVGGISHR